MADESTYALELEHAELEVVVEGVRLLRERWNAVLLRKGFPSQDEMPQTPLDYVRDVVARCDAVLARLPDHGLNS